MCSAKLDVNGYSIFPLWPNRINRRFDCVRLIVTLGLGCALFLWASLASAATLKITGVGEEIAKDIKISAGTPANDSDWALNRYLEDLPKIAKRSLAAIGYFSPSIRLSRESEDGEDFIIINVDPGDPVRINKINLYVDGPARLDSQFMPAMGKLLFRKNAVFRSADYEASKAVLLDAAQDTGYFDFEFTTSQVRVSRNNLTADIDLIGQSGERYTFGNIKFDQSIFSDTFPETLGNVCRGRSL